MPRGKNKLEKDQGFTTVELLTVIAILGFLGLAFILYFLSPFWDIIRP